MISLKLFPGLILLLEIHSSSLCVEKHSNPNVGSRKRFRTKKRLNLCLIIFSAAGNIPKTSSFNIFSGHIFLHLNRNQCIVLMWSYFRHFGYLWNIFLSLFFLQVIIKWLDNIRAYIVDFETFLLWMHHGRISTKAIFSWKN